MKRRMMIRRETATSAAEEWGCNMDSCGTSGEGIGSQGALSRTWPTQDDLGASAPGFPHP